MTENQIKKTGEFLTQLFEIEGITQVVCVDDQYRELSDETLDTVFGQLMSWTSDDLQKLPEQIPELQDTAWEHEEVWKDRIREIWEDADTEKRREFFGQISQVTSGSGNDDITYSRSLKSIMGLSEAIEFQPLSYNAWEEDKHNYLNEENIARTLFLFDQDLSKEEIQRKGMDIITEILGKHKQVTCGLLSHTFAPDEEYGKWKEFAKGYKVDENRFVLISKQRLHDDRDEFAPAVRRTLLSKYCNRLKNRTLEIIKETFEISKQEIDRLSIYDFEQIVFSSSSKEGVWEPETLFRLYNLYQRQNARKEAFKNNDLRSYTDIIRKIHEIPMSDLKPNPSEIWKIQRREIYEDGEHINGLHMPIELGDIFQKTNGEKKFILLAQPCNLMVRLVKPDDGKRASYVREVILAEIVSKPTEKEGSCYELLYFDETNNEKTHYVNFNETHSVLLCVLDLCVYNEDGNAKMGIDSKCPPSVIPAWEKRFDRLKKKVKKIVDSYKAGMENGFDKKNLNLLLPKSSLFESGLFKGTVNLNKPGKEILEYSCRRIGRLCQPRAGEMLTKYAQHISRSAFEHDFGKEKN